jgi:hypothetical protein
MRLPSRRRAIAITLLAFALLVDVYALTALTAPKISIPVHYYVEAGYWKKAGLPPVAFDSTFLFSAEGALSVNNPVHVHAILLNMNISNFLQYYTGIALTDAYDLTAKDENGFPKLAELPFKANAQGEYEVDGDVIWSYEGPTWPFLLPNLPSFSAKYTDIETGMPVTIISSVSDTLSKDNNVITQKLTWILIGFSILTLQPILEALIAKERPSQPATVAKPRR